MKINYEKIKKDAVKLEKFPGYLPCIIRLEINEFNYLEFIEKEGLLDKLYNKLVESRKFSFSEMLDEFARWVNDNPEYKDFLIEE